DRRHLHARKERALPPELLPPPRGEPQVDRLQVPASVVTRNTFGLGAQKTRGYAVGEGIPGILDRIAILPAADQEVDRPGGRRIAGTRDQLGGQAAERTVFLHELP